VGKEFADQIHEANVPMETWLVDYRVKHLREILSREPATPTDLKE
jgi:D-alanyl-D-alanine carboxypeptidase